MREKLKEILLRRRFIPVYSQDGGFFYPLQSKGRFLCAGYYSPRNLRPPTRIPNATPKHMPEATSRTKSDPWSPARRGFFRLLKSGTSPMSTSKKHTDILRLFMKSFQKSYPQAYPLARSCRFASMKATQYRDSLACFRISVSTSRKGVPSY